MQSGEKMAEIKKRKILVVDDSKSVAIILKNILNGSNYEIIRHVQTGEEGVLAYEELKPDLVTIDLILPGISGIEAIRKIIAQDPQARIIVISSVAGIPHKLTESLEAGAKTILAKPLDQSKVIAAFDKAF